MKKIIALLLIFSVSWQIGQAQQFSKAQIEEKAAESFANENWSKAMTYYKKLIGVNSLNWEYKYMAGESARHLRLFDLSESFYDSIPEANRVENLVLTNFWLGSLHKSLMQYDTAIVYYERFQAQNAIGNAEYDAYSTRAAQEIEVCLTWANEIPVGNTTITHLDTTVNSYLTDIAPFRRGDVLRFSTAVDISEKQSVERKKTVLGVQPRGQGAYMDMKIRVKEKVAENAPSTEVNLFSGSPKHHVNYSENDAGTRAYFNVCTAGEKTNEFICAIYVCKLVDGNAQDCIRLPETINKPDFTATQPYEGYDAAEGKSYLFFASDRDKENGDLDIWCSYINDDGDYSAPLALENINSDQDDMTPYFHASTQTLFYSSGGFENYGGMDIFKSHKEGNTFSAPENVGKPINSGYDDLYYNFDHVSGKSYFASNRPEALCNAPNDDCSCTDIFEAAIQVDLEALVYNGIDNSPLLGATVELLNVTTSERITLTEDAGNEFKFPKLYLENDYQLIGSKVGYSTASVDLNTRAIMTSQLLEEKLILLPEVNLIVYTYDKTTNLPLGEVNVQLIDITKSITRTIERKAKETEINKYISGLSFGRSYRVTGSKTDYTSDEVVFSTLELTEPKTIEKKLYLAPTTIEDLDEVVLYFNNDHPLPKTRRTTCPIALDYGVTYSNYASLDKLFATEYAAGKSGTAAKAAARQDIADFFAKDVLKGFNDLEFYMQQLEDYLATNPDKIVVVVLQGYASPVAPSDYNKDLTERRISCVKNHFKNNNDKALLPYISKVDDLNKGRLRFKPVPNGEETAKEGISDDKKNASESIYSPDASRERRVKILRFEVLEEGEYTPLQLEGEE